MRRAWPRYAVVLSAILAAGTAEAAEPYKVGPGGTHATIQSAIDAAIAAGGDRDILVAAGRWPERLQINVFSSVSSLRRLRLYGGYGFGFTTRTEDASRTIVDAGGLGLVLKVDSNSAARFYVNGFTFTRGGGPDGGGIRATLRGSSTLTLENNRIVGNVIRGETGTGAGFYAGLWEDTQLWVRNNLVQGNSIESIGAANGAGLMVFGSDSAYIEVRGNRILDNEAVAIEDGAFQAGLGVGVHGDAGARVFENVVSGNRAVSPFPTDVVSLRALRFSDPRTAAWLEVRRNWFLDNSIVNGVQLALGASAGGRVTFTDNVVARGTGPALRTSVEPEGEAYLTNLTIARSTGEALAAHGSGVTYLSSTILFENGGDVSGPVTESHNFRGDPLFVDPAGDYHLRPGSPAIDAGHNAPPGGLGPQDIDKDVRTRGRSVDIGADEAAPPSGRPGEPVCSAFALAGQSWPICRCLSEPDLVHARCGALVDDVFLDLRVPIQFVPGTSLKTRWSITPSRPLASKYRMGAEAFIDGQWVAQPWLGPTAPALKEGQTVNEPFVWQLPAEGATPVRTTLEYFRPGFKEPSQVTIEVTMPDPSLGQ